MNIRRFFDRVQISCHLLGFHRLANFFGLFGTPAFSHEEVAFEDRPTLKCPVYIPPEARGDGYSLVDGDERLVYVELDPTFNDNPNIDVNREVAFASTKLDVN